MTDLSPIPRPGPTDLLGGSHPTSIRTVVTALTDHIEVAEERLDNLETMARWLWLTVIFELALIVVVMLGTHL